MVVGSGQWSVVSEESGGVLLGFPIYGCPLVYFSALLAIIIILMIAILVYAVVLFGYVLSFCIF